MKKKVSKSDLKILREACKKFREAFASVEEMRKHCEKDVELLKNRGENEEIKTP